MVSSATDQELAAGTDRPPAFLTPAGGLPDHLPRSSVSAGIQIYDAPPSMLNAIRARAQQFEAEWVEVVSAQGFDARLALEALRRQSGVNGRAR